MSTVKAHASGSPARSRRSIPAALGISVAMAAVIGAISFFLSLFIAIIVFLIIGTVRGGAQSLDFSQTYRVIALPVGLAGIVVGFFWTLVHSLRGPAPRPPKSGLV